MIAQPVALNRGSVMSLLLRSSFVVAFLIAVAPAGAEGLRPNILDPSYDHDRWRTQPRDIIRQFRAFTLSFDSADDDNGDGRPDRLGVPEWVAQEVKRFQGRCIPTAPRPGSWFTEAQLHAQKLAPADATYAVPRPFRDRHPDWFERGHLAMKFLAERLGADAAWNTHITLNAVPQRKRFNGGIWADLEFLTGAWANRYGAVWVVTGPVFVDRVPISWLGTEGRHVRAAIPEAIFKIVIRDGDSPGRPHVLAFLYPQIGPGYTRSAPYDHKRFLTTIAEIEELTGLTFLNALSPEVRAQLRDVLPDALWPVARTDFIEACRQ